MSICFFLLYHLPIHCALHFQQISLTNFLQSVHISSIICSYLLGILYFVKNIAYKTFFHNTAGGRNPCRLLPFYGAFYCVYCVFPFIVIQFKNHTSSGRSAVLPVSQVSGLTLIIPGTRCGWCDFIILYYFSVPTYLPQMLLILPA